ncbi:metal-dependent hydrolase [Simiduia curdlanivorans]|uniref:Metal-dependent hydrolase n=1 Tax=Simiduia curdlanivorans TaxID=1492769 RepID=A0ABV8V4Q8_9GAMM|nr:metal-dependent hydrolase [Simiduia curdlanivorans]MDN3641001.1 metal-dependent hydrolase [Simiduia curdlanivorans]
MTHALIPVALTVMAGRRQISWRLCFWGCVVSILPDADVIAFKLGIPYQDILGHRGFTHSVVFSLMVGSLGAFARHYFHAKGLTIFLFFSVSTASHALLDALTNGGLGVALAWPFVESRYFLPWRVIEVSPIGLKSFLSARGASVLASEVHVVWLPLLALVLAVCLTRITLGFYLRSVAHHVDDKSST